MIKWTKTPVENPEKFREEFKKARDGAIFTHNFHEYLKVTGTVAMNRDDDTHYFAGIDF